MIDNERIRIQNIQPEQTGEFVLYWMQAAQRVSYNHALEYAVLQANRLGLPLVVLFGLTPNYPGANIRHYTFMLEGLTETAAALETRGATFVLQLQSPELAVVACAERASLVVTDCGYTRVQDNWRRFAADNLPCRMVVVETEVVIPTDLVSEKEEYAAATIRPKIHRQLDRFLVPLKRTSLMNRKTIESLPSVDHRNPAALLDRLTCDLSVHPITALRGGSQNAQKRLKQFVSDKLSRYDEDRNDPNCDGQSGLSPYLHFGQISPIDIALAVKVQPGPNTDSYLNELIVWRELAINFVRYNKKYDSFDGLPAWARGTLMKHASDTREWIYSPDQLENAQTHDPYWNAAQREMTEHGKMHGYMRMYWAKKIIEWSRSPQEAYATAVALNDKYELDGRDPNGYAGVAWAFGKHDRPWAERPIFGMIRYMNAAGLKRKFDADAYVRKILGPDQPSLPFR